jgi:RimJ/RimL family protein N-acetyltransferase
VDALLRGRAAEVCPFTVVRRDGAYVGDLGLWREDGWVVAYALDPAVHGRGVGTAVVGTVLEWGAAALRVRSVQAVSGVGAG